MRESVSTAKPAQSPAPLCSDLGLLAAALLSDPKIRLIFNFTSLLATAST